MRKDAAPMWVRIVKLQGLGLSPKAKARAWSSGFDRGINPLTHPFSRLNFTVHDAGDDVRFTKKKFPEEFTLALSSLSDANQELADINKF